MTNEPMTIKKAALKSRPHNSTPKKKIYIVCATNRCFC